MKNVKRDEEVVTTGPLASTLIDTPIRIHVRMIVKTRCPPSLDYHTFVTTNVYID